jgi:hypothetical protein
MTTLFESDSFPPSHERLVGLQAFSNELGSSFFASRRIAGTNKDDGATTERHAHGAAD